MLQEMNQYVNFWPVKSVYEDGEMPWSPMLSLPGSRLLQRSFINNNNNSGFVLLYSIFLLVGSQTHIQGCDPFQGCERIQYSISYLANWYQIDTQAPTPSGLVI